MILTGPEIKKQVAEGRISITPYDEACVGTTSYDLALGGTILQYQDAVLDAAIAPRHQKIALPPEGLRLQAGDFVLAHSVESVSSDHYAALIHARSSIARLGLFVHVTSDLIHVGSAGQITFQLYATMPITLRAGLRIAQITFWVPKGDITLYRGKYYGAKGPRASEAYKDFEPTS